MAGTGGGGSFDDDEGGAGSINDINVTPLVDVTLVLLIIMMVAAPLLERTKSIDVELPKASTGDDTAKSTIALTLRKDGKLFYGDAEVDEPEARRRIDAEYQHNHDVQAIIAGDKGVPYGDVMHLIDMLRGMGITKYALNIDSGP